MSKHRPFATLRFCPKCGVNNIKRDPLHDPVKGNHRVEYVCLVCGFGFCIGPSKAYQNAEAMFAKERSVRIGNMYQHVTPDAKLAFEKQHPEPWMFRLWRLSRRLAGIKIET